MIEKCLDLLLILLANQISVKTPHHTLAFIGLCVTISRLLHILVSTYFNFQLNFFNLHQKLITENLDCESLFLGVVGNLDNENMST